MPARCQIVVLIEVLAVQEVNLYADRGVCFSERLGRKIQEKCAPSSVQAHPRVNRGDGTPERPHPGDEHFTLNLPLTYPHILNSIGCVPAHSLV
jgi:hypothetical protein